MYHQLFYNFIMTVLNHRVVIRQVNKHGINVYLQTD